MLVLLKKPSAWTPLALSLLAWAGTLSYLAIFGVEESQAQTDEGLAARLFQLSLLVQVVVIGIFAAEWLPKIPKQARQVLALQILAAGSIFLFIFWLEL